QDQQWIASSQGEALSLLSWVYLGRIFNRPPIHQRSPGACSRQRNTPTGTRSCQQKLRARWLLGGARGGLFQPAGIWKGDQPCGRRYGTAKAKAMMRTSHARGGMGTWFFLLGGLRVMVDLTKKQIKYRPRSTAS